MQSLSTQDTFAARSFLFVPGDRPERFDKAWASQADEVIIDLEDAVAPHRKAEARAAVSNWLRPEQPVWIRVNAADTEWFSEDLRLGTLPGVAGIMLPKADVVPAPLRDMHDRHGTRLLPIVESALGMQHVRSLAATPGVTRLAFGAIDFQVDLAIAGDDDALLYFRSEIVLASRLAGLPSPIDGVTVELNDADRLRVDTERTRRLGFGGKLCIHPNQIALVHDLLSPTPAERDWAASILAAWQASAGQAVALDGKMIDRPVLLKARRIASSPRASDCLRVVR